MGLNLNMKATNQIAKGVTIFEEGEDVESLCLVLKGRVNAQRNGIRCILGSGNFIGICDLYAGKYEITYSAFDNVVLYPFPVRAPEDIETVLAVNKEYGGLMVVSLNRYIRELYGNMRALIKEAGRLYLFLMDNYELYKAEIAEVGLVMKPFTAMDQLQEYERNDSCDIRKAEYYTECAEIPIDAQKAFYQTEGICLYNVEEQTQLVGQILLETGEVASYIFKLIGILLDSSDECLFKRIAQIVITLGRENLKPSREIIDCVDRMVERINDIEALFEEKAGVTLPVDREALENLYYTIISGEAPVEEAGVEKEKRDALNHSMDTILEYAGLSEDDAREFRAFMEDYKQMKDKNSSDDAGRKLRKQLSNLFYKTYEQAFLAAHKAKDVPLAVNLFLKYGMLDETLLREEQLNELIALEDKNEMSGPCKVYNIKDWLTLIYEGKKLPSKSEFDMDYEEYIRSRKKGHEITEEQAKKDLMDLNLRFEYEMNNMFKYNGRIISGQATVFVPFLQESSFITSIRKAYVTSDLINEAVNAITAIDYSIFHREVMYGNDEAGIKKEFILKPVYPDIILLPNYGESAAMWQDLSGRKRDSKGRFLLPVFTTQKLKDMLIPVFGRFRWEICRTEQGSMWNNIKYHSLTSEYMDYIQFYRKNRDLSEEKKEKLKIQIQKSRNNSREVFVIDYTSWIVNESQGAIRLNKVAREILATYCPFSKNIREAIRLQPLFADAMERYYREKGKKVRELELKHRVMEKDNITIPDEILETEKYYNEL